MVPGLAFGGSFRFLFIWPGADAGIDAGLLGLDGPAVAFTLSGVDSVAIAGDIESGPTAVDGKL